MGAHHPRCIIFQMVVPLTIPQNDESAHLPKHHPPKPKTYRIFRPDLPRLQTGNSTRTQVARASWHSSCSKLQQAALPPLPALPAAAGKEPRTEPKTLGVDCRPHSEGAEDNDGLWWFSCRIWKLIKDD